ncbi:MAG: hypothetical protein C0467_32575 [Planctomycetaceae bacterium]|nr:hypothetical protein [Planctomycetaceae bacterium]
MIAPKLPTVLAGLLTVGLLCVNAARAVEAKKGDAKSEPAATVVALTPTMSIQLLPGYTHEKKKGTDSVVGEIVKKDGPTISYDIGFYGPKTLEDELWHKEQTLLGKKVKIVFSKQKELLVVVGVGEKVYASFYTKVKSEEDVAEVLLSVLSCTQEKK